MAEQAPILILQMQRMGDLILTFPLMVRLMALYPGRPIWVTAEKLFFEGLLPVSPQVTYIPWEGTHFLHDKRFHFIMNLSHRPEAAELAGKLEAEEKYGPVRTEQGLYIRGQAALHRAGLVHNNRHNLFHWADLNMIDLFADSPDSFSDSDIRIDSTTQAKVPPTPGKIGLFLGASEEEKRPPVEFWAQTAKHLLDRGLHPVFLGGRSEGLLGKQVADMINQPNRNLTNRFKLPEFTAFVKTLALLITPDTGPMHLASWIGTDTLNLSMGPVNPWETGPYRKGDYVLQAQMSCTGCWQCENPTPFACRDKFNPHRIAFLTREIIRGNHEKISGIRLPGLRLSRVDRHHGLYSLEPIIPNPAASSRMAVSRFWQACFALRFGIGTPDRARSAAYAVTESFPQFRDHLLRGLIPLGKQLSKALRTGPSALGEDFWRSGPPLLRPFTGRLHLHLQNADFSRAGFQQGLEDFEILRNLLM